MTGRDVTTESDLARWAIQHLQAEEWDCYPEVAVGKLLSSAATKEIGARFGERIADVVAIRGDLAMIIECKKSYSLSLLEQAVEWTRLSPLVAVAVPSATTGYKTVLKEHFRNHFGVGMYCVSPHALSRRYAPRLLRHNLRWVEHIKSVLSAEMKLSVAGASQTWRRSPYQDTLLEVRCALADSDGISMRELFARLDDDQGDMRHHYSSSASMKASIGSMIRGVIEPDIGIDARGLVVWTPEKCTKGPAYVAHVKEVAERRRQLRDRRVATMMEEA